MSSGRINVPHFVRSVCRSRGRHRKPSIHRVTPRFTRPKNRRCEVTDSVAHGLQLRIAPRGRKVWLHRYTWNDESIRLTLDDYEHLPLLQARSRIKVNQDLLHRGIDPRSAQPPRRTSSKRPPPARLLPSPHGNHKPAGEPAQAV
jgi:hypothetical protein